MSGNALGVVLPVAALGLDALLVRPQRGLFPALGQPIIAQITIEERHHDELQITEHPVEQGAEIADHAFKRPAEVVIRCAWSNSFSPSLSNPSSFLSAASGAARSAGSILSGNNPDQMRAIYQNLLELQETRTLVDVYTGKRIYSDMILRALDVTTDVKSEQALFVTMTLKQIVIVSTDIVSVTGLGDSSDQFSPQNTGATVNAGAQQLQTAPNFVSP